MKATLVIALLAVAIALLFAIEFRYERFMDRGLIVEVDRFTRQTCYVAVSIGYDMGAERALSIPKCDAK